MKVKIISAIVMCAIGFLLIIAAVSHKDDNADNQTNQTQINEDKDDTVKIWYAYKGYEEYILKAVEAYKLQNNSNINVELEYISEPGYFDYINKKSLDGNGPDIFVMGSEYLEKAYLLGLLEENSNDKKFNYEVYGETAIKSATYNSKLYAYPLGFDVSLLITNNDYVTQQMNTFEDIKKYADNFNNITEDAADESSTDNEASAFSNVKGILSWDVNTLLFNYGFVGSSITFENEGEKEININNSEVKACVNNYLLLKDYFSLSGEENYEGIKEAFLNGELVFMLAGTDFVKALTDAEINYSITKVIDLTDTIKCNSLSYTDLLAVNPRANNLSAAKELAEFISYDYAENMYSSVNIISCRKDITYENTKLNDCISVYDTSIIMPNLLETEDYRIIMEEALKAIWNGSDVEEILKNLQEKYSERIK